MASKTEYYDRVIAALQSEITSLKTTVTEQGKLIEELKSTVARQQKEIDTLKASQGALQKSSESQLERINIEHLLLAVKRVCDDVIRTNNGKLPTMFADKQEFESFRKSAEQKFLLADTFTAYQKSQETCLKSIEEKLTNRYSLLTINHHNKNGSSESKSYLNLNAIIRAIKNSNLQWLKPILVCFSIALLALYLISTITD